MSDFVHGLPFLLPQNKILKKFFEAKKSGIVISVLFHIICVIE